MSDVNSDSIFRPACVLMAGRAAGFLVAFAAPVMLARIFDQAGFGTYKQLFLIFATLYSIAQLGLSESLFYFLPGVAQNGGRYAVNAMCVLGVAGAVCLSLLYALQDRIATWLNNDQLRDLILLIGLFLWLMLVSSVLEIIMTARKRYRQASVAYAVSDLLRASAFIVPALWSHELRALLYGAVVFAALRLCATVLYLRREFSGQLRFDATLLRTQLAYAAPFAIYVLADVAQANLHLHAVSWRFDAATFALYSVGCLSIPLVEFLMSSAGNVMMVSMRERVLKGDNDSVRAIWSHTTRKLTLIFAPLAGGLIVVAHDLIVLMFTRSYERSVPVFMVWSLSVLLTSVITDGVLRVYAQMRFLMLLSVIKLLFMAATVGWFLSNFQLQGAVWIVLLTLLLAKVLGLLRIARVMQCRFRALLPWRSLTGIVAIAALAMVPAMLIKVVMPSSNFLGLLMSGSIYTVMYVVLIWHFGPLESAERQALGQWTNVCQERLSWWTRNLMRRNPRANTRK